MNHKLKLSVLFLKENDSWVGQCLEYDIAAQGKTVTEAKTLLCQTIAAQAFLDASDGKVPLKGIKEAPAYYRTKFNDVDAVPLKYTFEFKEYDDFEAEIEDARLIAA